MHGKRRLVVEKNLYMWQLNFGCNISKTKF